MQGGSFANSGRAWEGADSLIGVVKNLNLNDNSNSDKTAVLNNGMIPQVATSYGYPTSSSGGGTCELPILYNGPLDAAQYTTNGSFMQPTPRMLHPSVMNGVVNGYHTNGYHHASQNGQMANGYQPISPMPLLPSGGYLGAPEYNADFNTVQHTMQNEMYMNTPNLGWGGQAIQDSNGFKAPWFGKTRGRGSSNGSMNGNKSNVQPKTGRGNYALNNAATGSVDYNGHANGGKGRNRGNFQRSRSSRRSLIDSIDDGVPGDVSVDSIVKIVGAVPANQPLGEHSFRSLFQLEGRSCAVLLKELSRVGLHKRAAELFDWVRALPPAHPLQSLLDVFSYTAAISLCITSHDVNRALTLAAEMSRRGIERNVHTYTALMNVCIKCSRHELALDTYKAMRTEGCLPNVVTFNTLIDVYGKMGNWEEAIGVLGIMKMEGVEPVLRTYNTLLIACNMCSQPREAVAMYRRMLDEGFSPNSTTYNALISAYGKAGQLDRVMEVFQEMLYRGCERNVITYSSLISACEKAGRWELALELFQEMLRERCTPNTVTFNSLITALGQGSQWEKAQEVFEQMQAQGCTPDVVTYTALISSLEKGGQWRLALNAFERMRQQGCRADSIVYNAIIDALWETGVVWAQREALTIFSSAIAEGHFLQGQMVPGMVCAEVNLHAMTAGVAMLCLYAWLVQLKELNTAHGTDALPVRVVIVTDRGRVAKEQGNLVVKEAVAALMVGWAAPFKGTVTDNGISGSWEAVGSAVGAWLNDEYFERHLFALFPCSNHIPSSFATILDDPNHHKETSVEQRCHEAFAAVRLFEKTHCLALQNMGFSYLQKRSELVAHCRTLVAQLGVKAEACHDAVLLMDRVMSTSLALSPDLFQLLAASCVMIATRQAELQASGVALVPSDDAMEVAIGMPVATLEQMEWNIRQVLGNDTAAISTLRCLKLYLERLGANHVDQEWADVVTGSVYSLVDECLTELAFLNCRPSVIAAAVLYTDRRSRGLIPFWPTMLAKLTGYQDMSTPELSVAIKAAQKIITKLSSSGPTDPSIGHKIMQAITGAGHQSTAVSYTSTGMTSAEIPPMDAVDNAMFAFGMKHSKNDHVGIDPADWPSSSLITTSYVLDPNPLETNVARSNEDKRKSLHSLSTASGRGTPATVLQLSLNSGDSGASTALASTSPSQGSSGSREGMNGEKKEKGDGEVEE